MRIFLLTSFILRLFFSCGQDQTREELSVNQGQSDEIINILFSTMKSFEAQVFYEDGAAPYTDQTISGRPVWNFFEKNASSALKASERGVQMIIPKNLSSMTKMSTNGKSSWTTQDIFELSNQFGSAQSNDKGILKIFFLNGFFANAEGDQPSVLGVQLTNTMVVAVFKDNIKKIRSSQGYTVARFSEQAVLVHEFGHALGLVNNGIEPQSAHHDSAHGAHCTQNSCVMYYLNEGASGLGQFIRNYITTGDEDLFGQQCLNDLHSKIQ